MGEKEEVVDGDDKVQDKHKWGAADLEKVTDHQEEKDDFKGETGRMLDNLGKLVGQTQTDRKVVNIKKEDLQMIMDELELPKVVVEKKLVETNGDAVQAMRSLLGFQLNH